MADGATVYPMVRGFSSTMVPDGLMSTGFLTSFSLIRHSPNLAPAPIQQLTADMLIEPRIAPANTLTLNTEVPIDGSATLEVNYL